MDMKVRYMGRFLFFTSVFVRSSENPFWLYNSMYLNREQLLKIKSIQELLFKERCNVSKKYMEKLNRRYCI